MQNLQRREESLSGEEIAKLNEVQEGLGLKLHRLFSLLGSGLAAQAGHKGSVGIKKQTAKNAQGLTEPALVLDQNRIAGVGDPKDDLDAVNLQTLRRYLEDLTDDEDAPPKDPLKQVCRPVALSNMKTIETGMDVTYAVEILNEYVYLAGTASGTPAFEVYRVFGSNEFVLVGSLTPSEAFQRMVLHGQYIFGCRTNGGSQDLTVIDVTKPDDPQEIAVFATGAACKGLHAQGGYAFVACDSAIKIIDISIPATPIVTASI